jgi:tyrosine-protein phosphatase SIW14
MGWQQAACAPEPEGAVTLANNPVVRWALGLTLATSIIAVPVVYYRAVYNHDRRLRTVEPGVLYRSGCLTAEGFKAAVAQLGIKTIINLQDEWPDPAVRNSYFDTSTTSEIQLCQELGVHYVYIPPDLLSRRRAESERPLAIEQYLAVMDNPENYPVLIHCKAGLHRTGVMVAVFRMEYQGWSPLAALQEVKDNGFGEWASGADNDYIEQYIMRYKAGQRRQGEPDKLGALESLRPR